MTKEDCSTSAQPDPDQQPGYTDDPSVMFTEEFVRNLHTLASHAQLFLGGKFGKFDQDGRTIASFGEMGRIAGLEPGVRNHLVTMGFFDLSLVLLGYTNSPDTKSEPECLAEAGQCILDASASSGSWPDANFCTFGTWASLTIGRNVRNRFLPRRLDHSTPNAMRGAISRLAIDVRQTNDQRLTRLLGAAQYVVFQELCAALEALLSRTEDFEAVASDVLAEAVPISGVGSRRDVLDRLSMVESALAEQLKQPLVEPEQRRTAKKGVEERYADLQHGLVSYLLARQAPAVAQRLGVEDPAIGSAARSELIFRGNVQIESYVQIKVQKVLDYSVDQIASTFFTEKIGVEESENRGAGRIRKRLNRGVERQFDRVFDDVWARFVTDQILVARVGDEIIRLGRDLPDPPGSTTFYPPSLGHLCDNWASNLVLRYDHSFGYGVGTRSHVWRVYDDRMNWLINLLRSRQQSEGVWKTPFTAEEEVAVRAHRDPSEQTSGRLSWML